MALSWQSCVVSNVPVTVGITNLGPDSGDTLYGTELTELNISGGTLPMGVMIRESPTRASLGETRIQPTRAATMIDSFFDIYIEVSTDFGRSWQPALSALHRGAEAGSAAHCGGRRRRAVCCRCPTASTSRPRCGTSSTPMASSSGTSGTSCSRDWMEPPLFGASQTHTFDSQLDFQLSTDGGVTFDGGPGAGDDDGADQRRARSSRDGRRMRRR